MTPTVLEPQTDPQLIETSKKRTAIFLDLDNTLWEKRQWGGVISRENAHLLRALADDIELIVNTGRPQGQVKSSLLRAGNDGTEANWEDISLTDNLPLTTFPYLVLEDGLLVRKREDGIFQTLFNSLDIATVAYLHIAENLFSSPAEGFYRGQGLQLITDGVVTPHPHGYAVRDDVTAQVKRTFTTDLEVMYRQCNETTKLTYKPKLETGVHVDMTRIEAGVRNYLSALNPRWEQEAGMDIPDDAIDLYPLILEGQASGERFRKAEANDIVLRHLSVDNIVYIGDGPNDARAMAALEGRKEKLVFIAPYQSNAKVVEFLGQTKNAAYHLGEETTIDTIMAEVVKVMEKEKVL
ncbi:MAG: hypothetical protein ABIJ21_02115 [Nanoarchaeota archaeon]